MGVSQNFFETPFGLDNSNSFDVMHDQLFYVKNTTDGLQLVSHHLTTGEITPITPITSSKFSLNQNMTRLVTTKSIQAQNNLSSFRLIMSDPD